MRRPAPTTASTTASILLVDDDDLFVDAAAALLRSRGHRVQTAGSVRDALSRDPSAFDWLVIDDHLPDGSGLGVVSQLERSSTRVVVVSGTPRVEAALEAIRCGVSAFLPKPLDFPSLELLVGSPGPTNVAASDVGGRPALLPSLRVKASLLDAIARSRCPVLITGETGTGKGHLARGIQARSDPSRPFVALNCAAVPPTLFEAELFGVARGAFTGASPREGLLEIADGGTLFLDEIGELPPSLQAKLLTFLDDGVIRRVGSTEARTVSVRIIAATHRDLDAAVGDGAFRADLLHRLDVARLELTPLRERLEDLEELSSTTLRQLSARDGVAYELAPGELQRLARHGWPGNVRELQNAIERSTLAHHPRALGPSRVLRPTVAPERDVADLSPTAPRLASPVSAPEDLSLATAERAHILAVIASCGGNRSRAASMLGIGVATLRRKLARWSMEAITTDPR